MVPRPRFDLLEEPTPSDRAAIAEGGLAGVIVRADTLVGLETRGPIGATDAWIRGVIAQHHALLGRVVCPFIPPALERGTLFYAPVMGCHRTEDVQAVMDVLVERFVALPPTTGPNAQLKALVAIFVDVDARDGERVVIAAHHELKNRCTARGLMVGEFAPGYRLASTRNPSVNVGEAPVPVLALRHMLPSDRRFLDAEDQWLAAWANRFGADRVPLFQAFSGSELAAMARVANELTVEAGRVLCQQGDVGHEFFLILEGEATVRRNGKKVATLGPLQFFGELALLTRYPRNATVTAETDMTLFVLGQREFKTVIDSIPGLAHKLLAGLAERLSTADVLSAPDATMTPVARGAAVSGLPASAAELVPVLFGHAAFQHLNASCELGLHELLHGQRGLAAAEIARRLALSDRSVRILLLGTTALNLTLRAGDGYTNSAVVESMFRGGSWRIFRDLVEFEARIAYLSHSDYVESLRSGTNAGLRWFPGKEPDLYRRLENSRPLMELFFRCMNSWSRVANAILTASDWFDGCTHVLDVGGGDGVNAIALARAFPALTVTVLDLAGAVAIARRKADESGLGSRIRTVAGDIHSDPYPGECDCVLLANQISIWSSVDNLRLIARAYQALPVGGRLVVFSEFVADTLDGPLYAALDNVYFATLPTPESQLYPPRECVAWALAAGFREAAFFPGQTWTPHGAVVAVK